MPFRAGAPCSCVDGVDELTPNGIQEVTAYLRVILRQFPKARIVTTGTPEYVGGLLSLGFVPLAVMPWSRAQQRAFLQTWTMLWQKYVAPEAWAQAFVTPIDPILLNRWLAEDNLGLTPLELTLKVWAAYAGDLRGARPVDAIEAHIRRLLPPQAPLEALYALGAQASLNALPLFESGRARVDEDVRASRPRRSGSRRRSPRPGSTPPPPASPLRWRASWRPKAARPAPRPASLVSQMAVSGILAAHGGSLMRFAHPVYLGFLAGKALTPAQAEPLLNQPPWFGRTTTLRYLAAFGDVSGLAHTLLTAEDHILLRPRLTAARLLRDAPPSGPMAQHGHRRAHPHPAKRRPPPRCAGEVIAALALSGEPGMGALFRQLMLSPSNELRRLAALGAGVVHDAKSVESRPCRYSTLPPGPRGRPPAWRWWKSARRKRWKQLPPPCWGATKNCGLPPPKRSPAIRWKATKRSKTASPARISLVRRAIVYGLARVREPWAQDLLNKIPTQDEQWVVRNAAVELLESLQRTSARVPQRELPPEQMPWLIEFASKYGMGVIPGEPATDLFLLALKDENPDYRLAALHYLRRTPTEKVFAAMYPYLYGTDLEMREAVFYALREMAMSGVRLPAPQQFGLG